MAVPDGSESHEPGRENSRRSAAVEANLGSPSESFAAPSIPAVRPSSPDRIAEQAGVPSRDGRNTGVPRTQSMSPATLARSALAAVSASRLVSGDAADALQTLPPRGVARPNQSSVGPVAGGRLPFVPARPLPAHPPPAQALQTRTNTEHDSRPPPEEYSSTLLDGVAIRIAHQQSPAPLWRSPVVAHSLGHEPDPTRWPMLPPIQSDRFHEPLCLEAARPHQLPSNIPLGSLAHQRVDIGPPLPVSAPLASQPPVPSPNPRSPPQPMATVIEHGGRDRHLPRFPCPHCSKGFNRVFIRERHIYKRHGGTLPSWQPSS